MSGKGPNENEVKAAELTQIIQSATSVDGLIGALKEYPDDSLNLMVLDRDETLQMMKNLAEGREVNYDHIPVAYGLQDKLKALVTQQNENKAKVEQEGAVLQTKPINVIDNYSNVQPKAEVKSQAKAQGPYPAKAQGIPVQPKSPLAQAQANRAGTATNSNPNLNMALFKTNPYAAKNHVAKLEESIKNTTSINELIEVLNKQSLTNRGGSIVGTMESLSKDANKIKVTADGDLRHVTTIPLQYGLQDKFIELAKAQYAEAKAKAESEDKAKAEELRKSQPKKVAFADDVTKIKIEADSQKAAYSKSKRRNPYVNSSKPSTASPEQMQPEVNVASPQPAKARSKSIFAKISDWITKRVTGKASTPPMKPVSQAEIKAQQDRTEFENSIRDVNSVVDQTVQQTISINVKDEYLSSVSDLKAAASAFSQKPNDETFKSLSNILLTSTLTKEEFEPHVKDIYFLAAGNKGTVLKQIFDARMNQEDKGKIGLQAAINNVAKNTPMDGKRSFNGGMNELIKLGIIDAQMQPKALSTPKVVINDSSRTEPPTEIKPTEVKPATEVKPDNVQMGLADLGLGGADAALNIVKRQYESNNINDETLEALKNAFSSQNFDSEPEPLSQIYSVDDLQNAAAAFYFQPNNETFKALSKIMLTSALTKEESEPLVSKIYFLSVGNKGTVLKKIFDARMNQTKMDESGLQDAINNCVKELKMDEKRSFNAGMNELVELGIIDAKMHPTYQRQPQAPKVTEQRAEVKQDAVKPEEKVEPKEDAENTRRQIQLDKRSQELTLLGASLGIVGNGQQQGGLLYEELLKTEDTYVNSINLLSRDVINELLKSYPKSANKGELTKKQAEDFLNKLEAVTSAQKAVSAALKEPDPLKWIEAVQNVENAYSEYGIAYNKLGTNFPATTQAKWQEIAAKLQSPHSLNSITIQPIQRLPRYVMLFEGLAKLSPQKDDNGNPMPIHEASSKVAETTLRYNDSIAIDALKTAAEAFEDKPTSKKRFKALADMLLKSTLQNKDMEPIVKQIDFAKAGKKGIVFKQIFDSRKTDNNKIDLQASIDESAKSNMRVDQQKVYNKGMKKLIKLGVIDAKILPPTLNAAIEATEVKTAAKAFKKSPDEKTFKALAIILLNSNLSKSDIDAQIKKGDITQDGKNELGKLVMSIYTARYILDQEKPSNLSQAIQFATPWDDNDNPNAKAEIEKFNNTLGELANMGIIDANLLPTLPNPAIVEPTIKEFNAAVPEEKVSNTNAPIVEPTIKELIQRQINGFNNRLDKHLENHKENLEDNGYLPQGQAIVNYVKDTLKDHPNSPKIYEMLIKQLETDGSKSQANLIKPGIITLLIELQNDIKFIESYEPKKLDQTAVSPGDRISMGYKPEELADALQKFSNSTAPLEPATAQVSTPKANVLSPLINRSIIEAKMKQALKEAPIKAEQQHLAENNKTDTNPLSILQNKLASILKNNENKAEFAENERPSTNPLMIAAYSIIQATDTDATVVKAETNDQKDQKKTTGPL